MCFPYHLFSIGNGQVVFKIHIKPFHMHIFWIELWCLLLWVLFNWLFQPFFYYFWQSKNTLYFMILILSWHLSPLSIIVIWSSISTRKSSSSFDTNSRFLFNAYTFEFLLPSLWMILKWKSWSMEVHLPHLLFT